MRHKVPGPFGDGVALAGFANDGRRFPKLATLVSQSADVSSGRRFSSFLLTAGSKPGFFAARRQDQWHKPKHDEIAKPLIIVMKSSLIAAS